MPSLETNLKRLIFDEFGTPEDMDYNLLASILEMVRDETKAWVKRPDDAMRIPDRIDDAARWARQMALEL